MSRTTSDQDRRIGDRSIELGAASVYVADIGPASLHAVLAEYRDSEGREVELERILEDGTPLEYVEGWKRTASRWRIHAGKGAGTFLALLAALVLAAPAAAAPRLSLDQARRAVHVYGQRFGTIDGLVCRRLRPAKVACTGREVIEVVFEDEDTGDSWRGTVEGPEDWHVRRRPGRSIEVWDFAFNKWRPTR